MSRDREEAEIIRLARLKHDPHCWCDRRYVMSCPRMARAILEVGRDVRS